MSANEWLGWHFLPEDKRLRYGTREVVEVGRPVKVAGKLALCEWGLHASRRAIDALAYAPMDSAKLYACRVRLGGELIESQDKAVASEREVLWMVDATKALHLFACRVAEDAFTKYGNGDTRSLAAIQAKRDWLEGKITSEELKAAARAAEVAAWAAEAARAAWAAWAAEVAAWAAEAAEAAEAAAARTAAAAAARAAEVAAAAAAAVGAARSNQNILLEKMLEETHNDSLRA